MYLTILSTDQLIFGGEVSKVSLPGAQAPFQILSGHMPLASMLVCGSVRYTTPDDKEHILTITSGVVKVASDEVKLLVKC